MRQLIKITSNNGKTSYLFGTMHVNTKEVTTLPLEVETAFNSAITFVGECDSRNMDSQGNAIREWRDKCLIDQYIWNRNDFGHASDELKKTIYSLGKILPWYMYAILLLSFYIQEFRNENYDLKTRLMESYKLEQADGITTGLLWIISNLTTQTFITSYMIRQFPPLLLWKTIILRGYILGHLIDNCLDHQLYARAIESNKNVYGFQTRDELTQLRTATDILSYQEQRALFDYELNHLPSNYLEILHQNINNYVVGQETTKQLIYGPLNEQDDRINALRQRLLKAVVHDRDEIMAKKMQPYLSSGSAFFAVGNGHLEGVKARLVNQGHIVEEIPLTP